VSDIEEVPGKAVTVRFEARKCVHSRHCVLDRPDVFVPNVVGEWIHPDAATVDEIVELAHNCPSGAITYIRHDGGPAEAAPIVNTVRVRENGPLAFHGALAIEGQAPMLRATLCRCGHSSRKPFCDGSHTAAGFTATGEPATKPSEPLAQRDGTTQIALAEHGPLLVTGSLEIVSGTGRTIERCGKTALCRCGGSANKPFCDGSHKTNGFRAEVSPTKSRAAISPSRMMRSKSDPVTEGTLRQMEHRAMDYRDPTEQVKLISTLDADFRMSVPQFCELHHKGSESYLPTRSFEDHYRYCMGTQRFNDGPGNADTGRRLHVCLVALQAGATWERAIAAALTAIPK
jgi:CDGSH-type Zn-finger protein/uncharacterized Fe-S cluster protein YjdI